MSGLSREEIHTQLLLFLNQNDPDLVPSGYDLNGLVDFTMNEGIDKVQKLFMDRYHKKVDFSVKMTAHQRFQEETRAVSTVYGKNEVQLRFKLMEFFQKHDPPMLQQEAMVTKFVKFGLANGVDKLNESFLVKRYYEGISMDMEKLQPGGNVELVTLERTDYGLDIERLCHDLVDFFHYVNSPNKTDMVENYANWANTQAGADGLDKKMEQMHGITLSNYLESQGKEKHFDYEAKSRKPSSVTSSEDSEENEASEESDNYDTEGSEPESEEQKEFVDDSDEQRPFSDMDDEEIVQELSAFYQVHDPAHLPKVAGIIPHARKLGRGRLNRQLHMIYTQHLAFVPLPRPSPAIPPRTPAIPPRTPGTNSFLSANHLSHFPQTTGNAPSRSSVHTRALPIAPGALKSPPGLSISNEQSFSDSDDEESTRQGYRPSPTPSPPRHVPNFESTPSTGFKKPPGYPFNDHQSKVSQFTNKTSKQSIASSRAPPTPSRPRVAGRQLPQTHASKAPGPRKLQPHEFKLPNASHASIQMKKNHKSVNKKHKSFNKKHKSRIPKPVAKKPINHNSKKSIAKEIPYYQKPKTDLSEMQKIALAKQERIRNNETIVTDRTGKKVVMNVLFDACDDYRFDPMSMGGLCVCGFGKSEHKQKKHVVNAHLNGEMGFKEKMKLFGGR